MNEYTINEKSLIIGVLGVTIFDDVFRDSICKTAKGIIDMRHNIIDIPILKYDIYAVMVNMFDQRGHAIALIIDNRDKTFQLIDSAFELNQQYHIEIVSYMKEKGFTNKSEYCPLNLLPLKNDDLCIIWSIFLATRTCAGKPVFIGNPIILKEEFDRFFQYVWQIAFDNIDLYDRFLKYIVNLALNNIGDNDYISLHSKYASLNDKESFFKYDKFPIETMVIRPHHEMIALRLIMGNLYNWIPSFIAAKYANSVKNIIGIHNYVKLLDGYLSKYEIGYLMYKIVTEWDLQTYIANTFKGENMDISHRYIRPYIFKIFDLINRYATINLEHKNSKSLMLMIETNVTLNIMKLHPDTPVNIIVDNIRRQIFDDEQFY